jgi:hypothetical protein
VWFQQDGARAHYSTALPNTGKQDMLAGETISDPAQDVETSVIVYCTPTLQALFRHLSFLHYYSWQQHEPQGAAKPPQGL